jgi:hypothetical protein
VPDVPSAAGEVTALRPANARLRQVAGAKDTEIAVLRTAHQAQLDALRAQVEALAAEVADLRARLGATSRNSPGPPSSDGPGKPAPKSLRGKSGRKPGRPKGQPGATLVMTDRPDAVNQHEPGRCAGCGAGLARATLAGMERRQVTGLPEQIRALVTEHQITSRRCARGTVTAAPAPAGVAAPVQYGPRGAAACAYLWHGQFLSHGRTCQAMAELSGVPVSPGAVTGIVTAISAAPGTPLEANSGETGFRVAGRLAWVHSASAGNYALITVPGKRGTKGMDAAAVLPSFAGIAAHDAGAVRRRRQRGRPCAVQRSRAAGTPGRDRRRPARPVVPGVPGCGRPTGHETPGTSVPGHQRRPRSPRPPRPWPPPGRCGREFVAWMGCRPSQAISGLGTDAMSR